MKQQLRPSSRIDHENAEWARKFLGKKLGLKPPYFWVDIVATVVSVKDYADYAAEY